MKNTFQTTQDLVGKYINRYFWSDIDPVGKIVAVKSKTTVVVQKVVASENQQKMDFVTGGFSAHCVNQWRQFYEFTELDETFEVRLSKQYLKQCGIDAKPRKFYDYNF